MSSLSIVLKAVFLVLTATARADDNNNRHKNNNLRGLTSDIGDVVLDYEPYDYIENDAGISRIEYINLVNLRREVVSFWTPDRMRNARPLHKELDVLQMGLLEDFFSPFATSEATHNETADGAVFGEIGAPGGRDTGTDDNGEEVRRERNLQSVPNDPWEFDGDVMHAAGRLLFKKADGYMYRCSATAVSDGSVTDGQSIIITAAHCVYNDEDNTFMTNVMFVPHQDDGGSDVSDFNCDNDTYGCWTPSHAIVDDEWASKLWHLNIPADYGFLVVPNVGSHQGPSHVNDGLEKAVPTLDVSFDRPAYGEFSYGFGYPATEDTVGNPADFRYCRRPLTERSQQGGMMLDGCGLTAGASGGPWIQNLDSNGRGEIVGVNSYGPSGMMARYYKFMGAPRLYDNSAECLFEKARTVPKSAMAGGRGFIVEYDGDCASSVVMSEERVVITVDEPKPSVTSSPTSEPTASLTPEPTHAPTPGPTASPTSGPTTSPTARPTASPTPGPTASPTPGPAASPTPDPTPSPTPGPTASPTHGPTASPTPNPTPSPTPLPTPAPTPGPTGAPTHWPTTSPTLKPTRNPTPVPTPSPTSEPTHSPTPEPEITPSVPEKLIVWSGADAYSGCQVFTVQALKDITITGFDVGGNSEGSDNGLVFTRPGTHHEVTRDFSEWDMVFNRGIQVMKYERTYMGALDRGVPVRAGLKQSFYICLRHGLVYQKGKNHNQRSEGNDALEVEEGVATTGPFQKTTNIAKFRGAIQYFTN